MDEIDDIFLNNTALIDEPEVRELIERYVSCTHIHDLHMDRVDVLEAALREISEETSEVWMKSFIKKILKG